MTTRQLLFAATMALAGLAGCAQPVASSAPAGAPSAAPSPSRSTEPSRPPRDPTDQIKNTDWVVGTVTIGGSGPCYGLVTDDGTQYALHSANGKVMVKGTRMRIKTETALVRIHCGPGTLVEMTALEPLR